tara:strand:+ start:335 stop:544 length:210 start_codon:yes stop_codon:yes gene_type:complete
MKDKIFMILLGIIAVNLTIQTVKDVGIFPTAYAQGDIQKVAICNIEATSRAIRSLFKRSSVFLRNTVKV